MVNAQKWLDEKYPLETRNEIKELNIESKELDGDLDLTDFINLKKLDCSKNNLVDLKLNRNIRLEKIDCSNNKLLDLSVSNAALVYLDCSSNNLSDAKFIIDNIKYPERLIYLNFRNNCFSPGTLEMFSNFSNLEELYLGTTDLLKISLNIYNHFYGSLKPLEKLKKLRKLCIENTEINCGWEYLPDNLESLSISSFRERKTGEDLGLIEIMEWLNNSPKTNDIKKWKGLKKERINRLEKELGISKRLIDSLKLDLKKSESLKDNLKNELDNKNSILENLEKTLVEEKNNYKKSQEEIEKINDEMKDKLNISENKERELKKKVEDLQEENVIYKEANEAIKGVYEKTKKENEQLRNQLGLKSEAEIIKEVVKKDKNESKIEVIDKRNY